MTAVTETPSMIPRSHRSKKLFWLGPIILGCLLAWAPPFAGAVFASDDRIAVEDIRELLKQAEKHYRKGRVDEAEKLYRRVIELEPANSQAKLALALLLVKQRVLREAYDLSFSVAQKEPRNARAFAVLGAAFLAAGNFREARLCFTNSLSISRKEDLAWAGFGMLDFYENRISDSIESLTEASFRNPDEPDYYFALGQVSARAERYKEAADSYRKFLNYSNDMDADRRARIKGLINFLTYLGHKTSLYMTNGPDQTTVPISLVGNRPIVQLKLNDNRETLNFVLDTGSGITVISEETSRRLKIRPVAKGGHARGLGGDGRFEIIYGFVHDVRIGDVRVRNVPVYIRKFHSATERIDGYIGLSLISKFLTTIDYGSLTFSLAKKSVPASDPSAETTFPLRLTSSGFLSGEVRLEGLDNTFNFIVDTGASVSVISEDLASLKEVSQYEKDEKLRVIGSAGITENVPSFMLPRVTFGNHSRERVDAVALDLDLINEASGFQQAGILGGNFLRNYRLTFDFRNSRVTFTPISQRK